MEKKIGRPIKYTESRILRSIYLNESDFKMLTVDRFGLTEFVNTAIALYKENKKLFKVEDK